MKGKRVPVKYLHWDGGCQLNSTKLGKSLQKAQPSNPSSKGKTRQKLTVNALQVGDWLDESPPYLLHVSIFS